MIELFFWPTPNGYKPLIALEETGLEYRISPVNIARGEQFNPDFLKIAPNNRVPVLVDHAPSDGGGPISLFESGAILGYLAEKTGSLQPGSVRGRAGVQQWLHWQMGGLGPSLGQAGHFFMYAAEDVPYAKTRFLNESKRLLGVMEKQLADRDYLAGDYSIADVACYPWVKLHRSVPLSLDDHPRLKRWLDAVAARPAVVRSYEVGAAIGANQTMDDEARRILFGQSGR